MSNPSYTFVTTDQFTPNPQNPSNPYWTTIGNITNYQQQGNTFFLQTASRPGPVIYFLSNKAFRVRFSPDPNFDYSQDKSYAVVTHNLGTINPPLQVTNNTDSLVINTGEISVKINKNPYAILVYRGTQLINQDQPGYNLVYIPGQKVIANFKLYPTNAKYCGLGEKAGSQLLKNQFTLTNFNYDNFAYNSAPIQAGTDGGPLNPSEALYTSIPLIIENNPAPQGDYAGSPYSYGIFFDNPSQSYFNIGANDYSNMDGKYYFGALYGEMDYYFMAGDNCPDVLAQYTTLTGRSPMPPKYVFGFHQGGYGYYSRYVLSIVANSYRAARIPIDGLHIDVDFQNNYRTFTSSEMKFPHTREMMDDLHTIGFKCSTNITPLLTNNTLDENGKPAPYEQREALLNAGALLYDITVDTVDNPLNNNLFVGQVSYGMNRGSNPFPYPPLKPNQYGETSLGAPGNYPDYEWEQVQELWGEQYKHLIQDLGMDMIWQDMTCPALAQAKFPLQTFPLDLEQYNGSEYLPNAVIHNAYVINLLKATSNGLNKLRSEKRNFIIARGGYAGMQRYAGLWTGDSASSWDFLQINIPEVLNLGLSGVPISGCDIGGFAPGSGSIPQSSSISYGKVVGCVTEYQLFTRWMHLGSFLPWYRNHYNGYYKQFQEVYAYAEPVPTNCRKYIELRYQMIQIYYDAMYEWTQTGMPIARALFLNEPNDPNVYNYLNDQFFVGKDFLVAPIVTPQYTRNIYLPSGSQWYSFQNNMYPLPAPVNGGEVIYNYYADLTLVPIYVRAGAILPMRQVEQYVGELSANPLTINIYPGPDSQYQLYLDDGISTNAANQGAYRLTKISHQGIPNGQNIRLQRLVDNYQPPEPFYYVALVGTRHPSSVSVGGTALHDVGNPSSLDESHVNAYYWNQSIAITFIKVFDTQSDVTITALYA